MGKINPLHIQVVLRSPPWWHKRGQEMEIGDFEEWKKTLILSGPCALLSITLVGLVPDQGWFLHWEIDHGGGSQVKGTAFLHNECLKAAFGLVKKTSGYSDILRQKFRADCAEIGEYIRTGNYLNIPSPGSGADGDPNISVYITDEMRECVRKLTEITR